jgi:hypothetical protein
MTQVRKNHLDSLLNVIERNCDPTTGSEQCTRFSLECLLLIQHKLTPIVFEAIDVISDYLAGNGQLHSITAMRVRLWEYLDTNRREEKHDDSEVAAIRAVIFPLCGLDNPQLRDIVDHLSFFLEFINLIEPHYEEEEVLLRKYFKECL